MSQTPVGVYSRNQRVLIRTAAVPIEGTAAGSRRFSFDPT